MMDISDIMKENQSFKMTQVIDKNAELLKDDVIGKKKKYVILWPILLASVRWSVG